MAVLSIAICDDDALDLQETKNIINEVLRKKVAKYQINTFSSPSDLLRTNNTYHMAFLDIEMEGMTGIETAEEIHKINPNCLLFFVTHHGDYMDDAMNKHAFRFWTKPIKPSRLIYGIDSALENLKAKKSYITVTIENKSVKIFQKDIMYIYHSRRFTHLVTTNGELKTYDTFKTVSQQLTDSCFVETHASCVVNMNYISDYNRINIICSYNGVNYNAFISTRKYTAFDKRFKEWSCTLE